MDRSKQVVEEPVAQDMGPDESDAIAMLLGKLPRIRNQPAQIQWDSGVFGVPQGHVPLYVTLADCLEIVGGNTMLNISIIQLWCM